jgi:hypothetical protein
MQIPPSLVRGWGSSSLPIGRPLRVDVGEREATFVEWVGDCTLFPVTPRLVPALPFGARMQVQTLYQEAKDCHRGEFPLVSAT